MKILTNEKDVEKYMRDFNKNTSLFTEKYYLLYFKHFRNFGMIINTDYSCKGVFRIICLFQSLTEGNKYNWPGLKDYEHMNLKEFLVGIFKSYKTLKPINKEIIEILVFKNYNETINYLYKQEILKKI